MSKVKKRRSMCISKKKQKKATITETDVKEALQTVSNQKSPGLDGVHGF